LLKHETTILWPIDIRAGQVGGQQVRRKLNAVKVSIDAVGQRLDGPRLGETGRTLDEQVAVSQQ